jgi:hypothetical protein
VAGDVHDWCAEPLRERRYRGDAQGQHQRANRARREKILVHQFTNEILKSSNPQILKSLNFITVDGILPLVTEPVALNIEGRIPGHENGTPHSQA